ncbi:MAG: portal protein, partial [Roseococcus sp.]
MTPQQILTHHDAAISRRRPHEANWRDAYAHVLPAPHEAAGLYDATAADAAEQLAASLLAELTPPWSRWFGLTPVRALAETQEGQAAAAALEATAETLQTHLDRSNFAVEMHQAFLDLVITGTGIMLVEEAPPGETSALRFTAVPVRSAILEEGPSGRLDTVFREARMTTAEMLRRFPFAEIPAAMQSDAAQEADQADPVRHRLVEAVWPDGSGHRYAAVFDAAALKSPIFVAQGRFADAPFIAFRWLNAPGDTARRRPVI